MNKRQQIAIVFIILVLTACLIFFNEFNKKQVLDRGKGTYGIDVSRYQGKINWPKVKKWHNYPISFVYIKATEGASWLDPNFKYNIKNARKNNLKVGAYHYFRSTSSPEDQFNQMIKYVTKENQDLIPMIDLETLDGCDVKTYNKNLKIFLSLVSEHFGKKPLLYSTQRFYNTYLKNRYLDYYWSIARYNRKKPFLLDNNKWSVWQFSDKGSLNGIKGDVDINYFNPNFSIEQLNL